MTLPKLAKVLAGALLGSVVGILWVVVMWNPDSPFILFLNDIPKPMQTIAYFFSFLGSVCVVCMLIMEFIKAAQDNKLSKLLLGLALFLLLLFLVGGATIVLAILVYKWFGELAATLVVIVGLVSLMILSFWTQIKVVINKLRAK